MFIDCVCRRFSQSNQYNNSLLVTEVKPDGDEYLSAANIQSSYFIVEPTTTL